MKRYLALLVTGIMLISLCGCSNRNKVFLPSADDFLSVNTITGLLNRYQSVACFERLVNTKDGEDIIRSRQYYEDSKGAVAQRIDGDEVELYYNRLLLTSTDNGETVSYGVYLNESDQPENLHLKQENMFGQEEGAEISLLDQVNETFRFQTVLTVNENNIEEYAFWDVRVGDAIIGIHTVAQDDLRLLNSEVKCRRGEKETTLSYAAWTYLRPVELHEIFEAYRKNEDRQLITVYYPDEEEKRYFFPTGVTPDLYTDAGHQLFLDKEGTIPYTPEPVTEPITLYYK